MRRVIGRVTTIDRQLAFVIHQLCFDYRLHRQNLLCLIHLCFILVIMRIIVIFYYDLVLVVMNISQNLLV